MNEIPEDFEKYLTKEAEEEIARGLARGEADIKAGRVISYEELKKNVRRFIEDLESKERTKICG